MLLEMFPEALGSSASAEELLSVLSVLFSPEWSLVSGWVIPPADRRDGKALVFSNLRMHLHHAGPT